MKNTLNIYRRLAGLPAGTWLFGKAIGFAAPYFRSIDARIAALEPRHCAVRMKNRRRIRNHLGTVHAIAMCNMAELAGGMMTEVSVPKGGRWIPAGMTVTYVKKAKTDLVAVADGSDIDWSVNGNVTVPVTIKDTNDDVVFTAEIIMNLQPRPNI